MEAADIETSSDAYSRRFSGRVGGWFLEVQSRGVLRLLKQGRAMRVLEIGGGHAQLAGPLHGAGHRVTVQGSAPACAARVRKPANAFPFACCAMERLPFRDRAFDIVVSVRTLAHVPDPAVFLEECARVADHGVLIDFPSRRSLNVVSRLLFFLKRSVERDTRPYRLLAPAYPAKILERHGLAFDRVVPQFFWPMVLHRLHRSRTLGRALEFLPRIFGLTRLFGSPCLALYVRSPTP